ncbi:jg25781, partial [Pararge aegeria aegeria]
VASTPITEASTGNTTVLCSSLSSPELNATGGETQADATAAPPTSEAGPAIPAQPASESSSDTGDLMFNQLDYAFVGENNPNHVDENSNEENDVDEETMSVPFLHDYPYPFPNPAPVLQNRHPGPIAAARGAHWQSPRARCALTTRPRLGVAACGRT